MNNTALKKCLVELEKKEPNIAYVRGILETVIELNEPVSNYYPTPAAYPSVQEGSGVGLGNFQAVDNTLTPEEQQSINEYANGPVGTVY